MYKSFRVQNFRGFKDLRLDDLARVNLIAGKNNTGKSALLEAILTYTGEYDASRLLRAPVPRTFRDLPELNSGDTEYSGWETLFHNLKSDDPIRMCSEITDGQELVQKGKDRLEILVVDIDELPADSRLFRFSSGEGIDVSTKFLQFKSGPEKEDPVHLAWSRRYSRYIRDPEMRFPATFIPSSEMMPRSEVTKRFSELLFARKSDELLQVLKKFMPRLINLALIGEPASICGDLEGLPQPIPISSMGEGMRRLTSLLLAISTTRDGVVFIDEIENGLHFGVQGGVWKAIAEAAREYNVQIFATTHSYEMIFAAHKAFLVDEPYDFRLHRLHRSTKTGEITPTTFNRFTMSAALDAEAEVR